MTILKAGISYFLLVFGAGFVLGVARVLFIVPHVGTRTAELMEEPLMFIVIIFSARWIIRHYKISLRIFDRLSIGVIALVLMLTTEFTVVIWLRKLSVSAYFKNFDSVSGIIYFLMLGVFAVMPLLVKRKE